MLERFGMSECKPRYTPCEPKLETKESDKNEIVNPKEYREIVGSLIYVMTRTRPDISWIVSKLSQTLAKPKAENLVAAKHVLKYLKGPLVGKVGEPKKTLQLLPFLCNRLSHDS